VYRKLYEDDFNSMMELWKVSDINELFAGHVNPLITNVMIALGYKIHLANMRDCALGMEQIRIHKKRVRACFEDDITDRGYRGTRISQMVWAAYFIRVKIIEVGRLQYQQAITDGNKQVISIHIPGGIKLNIADVKKSLDDSKAEVERVFKLKKCDYICHSWLLSNQIHELVDPCTNIYKFHELFTVQDGKDCIKEIMSFVFKTENCDDYSALPENTDLQKQIKERLVEHKTFYLGRGILKQLSD